MKINANNIILFVGDAVRYDISEDLLSELGETYKTVASSLHTPSSFGSLLTGLDVPNHNVYGFQNTLPKDVPSIFDIDKWNIYFSSKEGVLHESLHRIFDYKKRCTIEDAQEPFIWIVRDPGGHAPYDGYDMETYELESETAQEYLHRVAGNKENITKDYTSGVDSSVKEFKRIISIIEEKGLANDTLCIYTSDHGELLGEYGLLGHNHVACPELVYVPITFVHPSIDNRKNSQLLSNTDILPTIVDSLGADEEIFDFDGHSVGSFDRKYSYNHFKSAFYSDSMLAQTSQEVKSVWEAEGGHAFVESGYKSSLMLYAGLLLKSHKGKQIVNDRAFLKSLKRLLPGHMEYDNPEMTKEEAEGIIANIATKYNETVDQDLDEATKDQLKDLGYM